MVSISLTPSLVATTVPCVGDDTDPEDDEAAAEEESDDCMLID
jgi:hypothetical protein